MPTVTLKRTGELLRKLFEILMKYPEGLPAGEALKRLAASVTLTPHEAGSYESSGDRRFEKIVRFSTVDCVKAGWLVKNKGTWAVTDAGVQAYKSITDSAAFHREANRLYRAWIATRPGNTKVKIEDAQATEVQPEESATVTYEQAEEQAWAEIERYLHGMNPYDFQQLVADVLQAMGYHVSWVAPPGKDDGVDIIAFTDPLGTQAPRIKVQVKRVGQKVDKSGLQSFIAIVNDGDVGLYVSTGGFTRDAEQFARSQERRKITLIDLKRLVDLWVEHYAKLDDLARQRLPLTPIYFLTPES
jgi:restriction system protein